MSNANWLFDNGRKPYPRYPEKDGGSKKTAKNRVRLPGPPEGDDLLKLPLIRRSPFHGLTTGERVAGRGVCVEQGAHEWAIVVDLYLDVEGNLRHAIRVKCARCDADTWSR